MKTSAISAGNPVAPFYRASIMRSVRNALRPAMSHWPLPVGVRLSNGLKCFVDLRSAIGRGVLVQGSFDAPLAEFIAGSLKPGDVFVDAGANIGCFSLLAQSLVGNAGEVHAFEVDPRALRCLRMSKARNGLKNLTIHETALGQFAGTIRLVTSDEMGNTFVTATNQGEGGIPMAPLDAWLEHFSKSGLQLIKIDVEGSELGVLRGARAVIERCRPAVVCEAIDSNLARFGHDVSQLVAFAESIVYQASQLKGTYDENLILLPVTH